MTADTEAKAVATAAAKKRAAAKRPPRERPLDFVDVVMLILAVFSVGLLLYVTLINDKYENDTWVFVVDTTICGIFLVEFIWRWRGTGWQRSYPFTHWYEVLGMIPIAHPALRGLRLLRVIVIVVRVTRLVYRVFGDKVADRVVDQLTEPIYEAIKKPIILLVVDEVVKVVEVNNIPGAIAQALRENSDELEALVLEKLNSDKVTGNLKLLPFSNRIVAAMIDTTMRVILEVLADPRVDDFVTDVVKENQERIRNRILADLDDSDPIGELNRPTRAEAQPGLLTSR